MRKSALMKLRATTAREARRKIEKIVVEKTLKKGNEILERKRDVKSKIDSEETKHRKLTKALEKTTQDDIERVKTVKVREYYQNVARKQERKIEITRILLERSKMTDHIKTVESLNMNGNLCENWRKFKRNFGIFATAIGMDNKTELVKVSTFLNAVGADAVEVFDSFTMTEVQRATYTDVLEAFENFCKPRKNTVYERYMFYQRNQHEGESFDLFLIDIKRLSRTCEFGAAENEMLRDRIVLGVTDKKLQTRLLETANLSYETAIEKCRTSEASREQVTNINKIATVNELRTKSEHTQHRSQQYYERNNNNGENVQPKVNENKETPHNRQPNSRAYGTYNNNNRDRCNKCNYVHRPRECPAYGKSCNHCKQKNHFISVCRNRNISTIDSINYSDETFSFDNEEFYVGMIEINVHTAETDFTFGMTWFEKVRVVNETVPFKVDTGAQIDVLPWSVVHKIDPKTQLRRTNMSLTAFGGHRIKPLGMCSLPCEYNNVKQNIWVAVVDLDVVPILGLSTCVKFGIVDPPHSSYNANNARQCKL